MFYVGVMFLHYLWVDLIQTLLLLSWRRDFAELRLCVHVVRRLLNEPGCCVAFIVCALFQVM